MSSPILHLPIFMMGNNLKEGAIIDLIKKSTESFDRAAIGPLNLKDAINEYITYMEMLKTKINIDYDHGGSRRFNRSGRLKRFNRSGRSFRK